MTHILPPKLRKVKTTGLNCPCCRDTGSHSFGHERKDCERCGYADINNSILDRLPATLTDLDNGQRFGTTKDTLAEHIATMHSSGRVTFKNNNKDGVLIVRVEE